MVNPGLYAKGTARSLAGGAAFTEFPTETCAMLNRIASTARNDIQWCVNDLDMGYLLGIGDGKGVAHLA